MNSEQKSSQNGTAAQPHVFVSWVATGNLLPIAVLVIISLAVYCNSLSNGFVFDDYAVIVENKHIKDLSNSLPSFFNNSYFKIAGGEASYRPLATLSYFFIHSVAGLNPFYYHLSSVLLHTLNVILVYLLFCLLLGDWFKALLAGLLFACHPALTETVDCITFNEDLLAAFFLLLALILYIKAVDKGPAGAAHLLSLFFFFCGLLSKEMAISLPAIILLYDLTFREAAAQTLSVKHILTTVKNRWAYYVGYAGIGLLYLVLRFLIFIPPGDGIKPHFGSLFERLLYLPNHIFGFVKLAIAPYDLNVEYVYSYPQSFFEFSQLAGFVVIAGLGIISLLCFRPYKEIFFGIWWFLIALFPVYNLFVIFNPFAERYLYIPVIGFCLVVPAILSIAFSIVLNNKKAVNTATSLVVIFILCAYAPITVARNRDWKDGLTLWSKTVKQSPDSGVARGSLGRAYQEQGLLDKALAEYKSAAKIMPNHFKAYYNLGVVYDQQGHFDQAVANYKKSISISPEFANAHYNLANLYQKYGLTDDAIYHYRAVIELSPEDFEARNNLGVALAMQGKLNEAILEWEKVLEIDPTNKSARDNVRRAKEILEKSN
ncbi:MAG: tetratricopeptide repeat protein [Deltaproteobacteria bacterium]|nr:tetratricopeptide repeat protein [Deltaproteobacteria bacterium]